MVEKRRFKITIDGLDYIIIGKSSGEQMRAVAKITQQQLNQLRELMPNLTPQRASILVALNAVSDQLKKQEEIDELKDQITALERQLAGINKQLARQKAQGQAND